MTVKTWKWERAASPTVSEWTKIIQGISAMKRCEKCWEKMETFFESKVTFLAMLQLFFFFLFFHSLMFPNRHIFANE